MMRSPCGFLKIETFLFHCPTKHKRAVQGINKIPQSKRSKVAGEKCGSCTCASRKRRNWEGNKPQARALIAEPKLKLWMLRSSPDSVSCPFVSRSRESTFVLTVLGA
ncbi:hypothetical protein VNO77_23905 [Canavalia gladiata]|uniref:Uncharacterized protein n=1 Tax=Canavalia gladiata TaxID=3824 RepID=A0AAN9L5S0_CANGL